MKGPLYISDDGKKQGTEAEVRAYENSLDPLAKFKFPWGKRHSSPWENSIGNWAFGDYGIKAEDAIALLNLMPLVEELRQGWNTCNPGWRGEVWKSRDFKAICALLLAYEKALGVEATS